MATYWLTPLLSDDPLTLGAERYPCPAGEELSAFRETLREVSPRLLMLFKANLLAAEEDAGICGADSLNRSLAAERDLVFDGSALPLSACARAFLDRLPSGAETVEWLGRLPETGWTERQRSWLGHVKRWTNEGYAVVFIKEEGGL